MNFRKSTRGVKLLLLLQLAVAILLSLLAMYFSGNLAAQSALLGSIVHIVPNTLYARTVFKNHGANSAKKIASSFYKGEAFKMALSIILFAVVFKFFNLEPLIFFGAYIGMQMLIWFAPLIFI